jgi:hypothetical protein
VRYTNDIEVVYRFSREFGPKACILWTGDDYIRLTNAVSGMKLAAGTTLLASTRKTVKFLGGDLECEPGVVFEALETMWNTTKLHGTFDISASSGNVVGSGIEMVGDPDFFVLKDYDNVLSVFVHAPHDFLVEQAAKVKSLPLPELEKFMAKEDKYRADYYEHHTEQKWTDALNFDLCLDSSKLGFDKCVEAIKAHARVRFGEDIFD